MHTVHRCTRALPGRGSVISEHLVASEKHSTNKLIDVDYSYIRSVLAGPWADGVCGPPSTPAAKKVKKKNK